MRSTLGSLFAGVVVFFLAVPAASGQVVLPPHARTLRLSVTLDPSIQAPAPLGTLVTWTATVLHGSGTLWYRFRARAPGDDFHVVRDFGPENTLDWTASEHEGTYEIEVSAREINTGRTAGASAVYQMTPRVHSGAPVISPTHNSLVFLYSAPPCAAGSRMRVQFQSADGPVTSTPYKACSQDLTMNFYLAGMRANTQYTVRHTVDTGSALLDGPVQTLATPDVSLSIAGYNVMQRPAAPALEGILLQSSLSQIQLGTDLEGNLLWFYAGKISLTRPEPGGLLLGFFQDPTADSSHQILREFDLAGTTIRETNAARISEQLAALDKRPINGFHHEVRTLPDGKILALAGTEQILTDVQGNGPVDVLGDMILVLNQDLQVVWAWDAFDFLDPRRPATLGETCTPLGGGCPPFYLAKQANDWLHGNALQLTADGNILYSARHQDWVIKIDYDHGQGSGNVIWRLGKDGDFQLNSADRAPWFSHQHDPHFDSADTSVLMLFDNGNVRYEEDTNANSRGQVLRLDEGARVATFVLNADLGRYSFALGAAQELSNGNYHFDLGILPDRTSESVEVDPSGGVVYAIQVATPEYRTFRMKDLYTP